MQLTITLLALLAFASSFAIGLRGQARTKALAAAVALVGMFGAAVVFADLLPAPPLPKPGPVQALRDGYVSSDRCRACHPAQYESWQHSFHRTMTQPGTLASVAAPLDGEPVELWGQRYRFFTKDGEPWVELPDPDTLRGRQHRNASLIDDGPRVSRPIRLVTGSHHYQVYWVPRREHAPDEAKDDRELLAVPVVWRIAEQRWITRSAAFLLPPELSNRELPWGLVCIKCHSTGGRPGTEPEMLTDYVELGIACEACHGPGDAHIEHYQNPLRRYRAHREGDDEASIVDPSKLPGTRGSEVCAQCHSLPLIEDVDAYMREGTSFRPGDAILDHFEDVDGDAQDPAERAKMFWSDGEIRVTGREWISMTRSKCHTQGQLSCMDCHSMHEGTRDDQLHVGQDAQRDEDGPCLRCHETGNYADAAHTHHQAGSSGSSCVNCHMPMTSYGLLGAIRTHAITSPRVDVELETGRPNACNLCHLDQTLAWTGEHLSSWYGQPRTPVTGLASTVADSLRLGLAGDAGQRAIAAAAMGWAPAQAVSGTNWMAPFLVLTLNDTYDAVRLIAQRTLTGLAGYEQLAYDPLAHPEQRIAAIVDLVPQWFEQHRSEIPSMPKAVPLDPNFGFDRERLDSLLSQRDNRPVFLTE